jgi:hypothetical protein
MPKAGGAAAIVAPAIPLSLFAVKDGRVYCVDRTRRTLEWVPRTGGAPTTITVTSALANAMSLVLVEDAAYVVTGEDKEGAANGVLLKVPLHG